MKNLVGARGIAAATVASLALIGIASGASAEDAATLTLGTATVLTLPAGDGVRDSTSVSVSSDVATTADVALIGTGLEPLPLAPVEITDPAVAVRVTVPLDGLPSAGTYDLVVTPASGEPVVRRITVGSGDPKKVTLALSDSKLYTWSGASPRTAVATVRATDETGLRVPFTGTVIAKAGGKSSTTSIGSATGASASRKVYASQLAAGTGTVTARLDGPTLTGSTASAPITIKKTAITGVSLVPSRTNVYPAKDGYRDSVRLTVIPAKSRPVIFPATGTVKVTYDGRTVKSWKLTSATKWTGTWDGLNGGRIVPGTYRVSVSIKGPEGTTRTARTTIDVSKRRLVATTRTVSYAADQVIQYQEVIARGSGSCSSDVYVAGDSYCSSADSASSGQALLGWGEIDVPTAVVDAQRYGATRVKVTANWRDVDGPVSWCVSNYYRGNCDQSAAAKEGAQSLTPLKLRTGGTWFSLTVMLGYSARAHVTGFTMTYTYQALV
ncbi:hypothetical protein [Demequina silvatica]|uniref:hypothetical protein n=1 Tax=Demequina silvatica TaxID=1638988 RepID=UPI000784C8A8|nr:hypothetical protein [Demequina silvatica]